LVKPSKRKKRDEIQEEAHLKSVDGCYFYFGSRERLLEAGYN